MACVVEAGGPQGRITVATRQLGPGDVILREIPAAVAPAALSPTTCCHCLASKKKQQQQRQRQLWCESCGTHETSWCSKDCREQYSRQHELECCALNGVLGLLFRFPAVELHAALLVLRIVVRRWLELGHVERQLPPAFENHVPSLEAAVSGQKFGAVMALQTHQSSLEASQPCVFRQLQQFSHCLAALLASPAAATQSDTASSAEVPPLGEGLGPADYLHLLCAVRINSFALRPVEDSSSSSSTGGGGTTAGTPRLRVEPVGAALAPRLAMLNHACGESANCQVRQEKQQQADCPQAARQHEPCGVVLVLRARRAIAEGEELTFDYAGVVADWQKADEHDGKARGAAKVGSYSSAGDQRRRWLQETKHFHCTCATCEREVARSCS